MVLSERNCDLIQVGGLLDSKGYGIAFTPGNNNQDGGLLDSKGYGIAFTPGNNAH